MVLIIGNKTFSSWSLRPWVLMKHFNIPFEERLIKLDLATTKDEIAKYSPSGKVPALIDGSVTVWESMAIAEYLNEKYPQKFMWPKDREARALARSVSSEMHSSFSTMRALMSHNLKKVIPGFDSMAARADIDRVKAIWSECLERSGGPFLFGEFSIADAMYAPVVNRFVTYDVKLDGVLKAYAARIRELPAHREWIDGAMAEDFTAPGHD